MHLVTRFVKELSFSPESDSMTVTANLPAKRSAASKPSRLARAFAITLAAASLGACGGGSADDALEAARVELRAEHPLAADDATAVKRVLGARLTALGAHGVIEVEGQRVTVILTEGDPRLVRLVADRGGELEVRPVLSVRPPDEAVQISKDPAPDASAVLPELAGGDVVALYILNPTELDDTAIDSAEAVRGDGSWTVEVRFTPAGATAFDDLASKFAGMQVAIVVDDVVVSAPTLQADSFDGVAVISGDFDERDAKTLAAVLSADPLPVPLTAR